MAGQEIAGWGCRESQCSLLCLFFLVPLFSLAGNIVGEIAIQAIPVNETEALSCPAADCLEFGFAEKVTYLLS